MSKAAIIAGLAAFIAHSAQACAADLLPPAPSLDSPALRGRFASETGAYLRADTSYGLLRTRSATSTFTAAVTAFQYDATDAGRAGMVSLGAGYRFSEFMRVDLTGEYRGSARYSARTSYGCSGSRCSDLYSGSIQSSVLMANVYGELGSWFDITPSVGFGAGLAHTTFAPMTLEAANGHDEGQSAQASQVRPSFALMAGASWDLSSKLKLEAGYRYMTLGAARSGAISCTPAAGLCAGQVQQTGLAAHDLRIGLRYGLTNGDL